MSETSVAFFRNLNLGQRRSHSPTTAELLGAFEQAGASRAVNFQVNGTVVFDADDPRATAVRAVALLTPVCGYADAVLVRSGEWVSALAIDDVGPHAEVSLYDGSGPFPETLPWVAEGRGLTVVRADDRHAVCVNDVERTSGGTWTLERRLGVPVTSRAVGTMLRLQRRLRELAG